MTQEEKNLFEFRKRMAANGRLPMNDSLRLENEIQRQRELSQYRENDGSFSSEEWEQVVRNRESFRKRMQAKGKLPKDSELLQRAETELALEKKMKEEQDLFAARSQAEKKEMEKMYEERIAHLESTIKKMEDSLKTKTEIGYEG